MILKNNDNREEYDVRGTMYDVRRSPLLEEPGVHRTSYILHPFFLALAVISILVASSCKVTYSLNQASIPIDIKTVKVNHISNHASYVNPELEQKLTDNLRQKVIRQTRLSQTNSDNADWEINGFITDYSFSTSAISGQQVTNNRLTVAVHITLTDHKKDTTEDYDVSRSFEFKGTLSYQQAYATLGDEIIRNLTDEIFNKLFSKW